MRLEDVINMNKKLVPKPSVVITICVVLLTLFCIYFVYLDIAGIGILVALMLAIIFLTIIPMNHIFNKSVFGDYAYQYMSVPISFQNMVRGKVIAAFIYCTISVLVLLICIVYYMIHFFNSGGSVYGDIVETSMVAFINMHGMISDNALSTPSVVFIFGIIYIYVIIESLCISAGVFYAVIIRNIIEPQRERITIAIGVALASVITYIAFSFLCVWVPGLFFKNDLAIAQIIIAGALKVYAAYGIMAHSTKLLEKRYSLN